MKRTVRVACIAGKGRPKNIGLRGNIPHSIFRAGNSKQSSPAVKCGEIFLFSPDSLAFLRKEPPSLQRSTDFRSGDDVRQLCRWHSFMPRAIHIVPTPVWRA